MKVDYFTTIIFSLKQLQIIVLDVKILNKCVLQTSLLVSALIRQIVKQSLLEVQEEEQMR